LKGICLIYLYIRKTMHCPGCSVQQPRYLRRASNSPLYLPISDFYSCFLMLLSSFGLESPHT
jgi:hypothetical protein